MICIDVMSTWRGDASQNDCMHNEPVWISGYQPYRNTQMAAIFMNTLPDTICIDVMSTLRGISTQNDWIHSHEVWVSG